MISSTKKYTAAGLLVHTENLVLLGRRSSKCLSLSGYWSVPCGIIDPGESPEEAARREFFEETDVEAKKQILFLSDFLIDKKQKDYFALFSMKIPDLIFPSSLAQDALEHDEWGFFKISKNSLPQPITKEIKECILKLKL